MERPNATFGYNPGTLALEGSGSGLPPLKSLLNLLHQLTRPLNHLPRRLPKALETTQSRLNVRQGVLQTPCTSKAEGDVEAGSRGAVDVTLLLLVADRIAEMCDRARSTSPAFPIDLRRACVVGNGELVDRVRRKQLEGLVVETDGLVQVTQRLVLAALASPGLLEAFEGYGPQLPETPGRVLTDPISSVHFQATS